MPPARALEVLSDTFGFEAFRPGQDEAVSALLGGEDVLAVMPTGAGKSLCFQVPALVQGGLTVVVSPLIALMQNQVEALKLSGVAAAAIHSGQSREENVEIWRDVMADKIAILYLAPERLMTERMLDALEKRPLSFFAIDEAHCISQWGPAFRPEYEALQHLKARFPDVPIIALTATADALTREHIAEKLFDGEARRIITGFDRPNLELHVTQKDNPKAQLARFMKDREGESGIVYCLSRKKTEDTAAFLKDKGYKALVYHAGMSPDARRENLDRFIMEEGVIMVATIAFGMGIDKPDIRFVFHMDLPAGPEAYYQEIGRAGRDGAPSTVYMLYGFDDIRMRRVFIEDEDAGEDRKRREHQRLNALLAFCETPTCRRQTLLAYFGEEIEPCGACDTCLTPVETECGAELGHLALTAIDETGERFGVGHIVSVLRGERSEKIERFGHDRLDVHGSGKAEPVPFWRSFLRQMVAAGLLDIDVANYGALRISEKGNAFYRGEVPFRFRRDAIKPKGKAIAGAKAPQVDLPAASEDLFARLKALRLSLAQARGVPAYAIFPDKALIDMAVKRPANAEEFGDVYGVGKAKQERFGTAFLEEIRKAAG